MYYKNEEVNGLQDIYSAMGYIAPNSSEDGVLEFEKLPDERYAVQNNSRTSTFNSNKKGSYYSFLECDLGETYPSLSVTQPTGTMDLEMLRSILIEEEAYIPSRLEFHFDLRSGFDGRVVEREEFNHDHNSPVWSILYNDKKNSERYGQEF